MNIALYLRLAGMMFGQFFIWGVWYVTLGSYLTKIGFQGTDIGRAYSTIAWAAVVSAFFVSLVADRYFSAQKLAGWLHVTGAALMYAASTITAPALFFWVLMAYAICYAPTLALTAAIGMRHCAEPGKQYPRVRVFGTLGWIVAGLAISAFGFENGPEPMRIAAGASLLLGFYCFTLPATPPQGGEGKLGVREILGLDALQLMRDRSFAVLSLAALLITLPFAMYHPLTNMYLNESGVSNVAGKMTLAQMSEVGFMLLIPFFTARFGIKKMLIVGMVAWTVRYSLFAGSNGSERMMFVYAGILLHGICYDFFYVTAQIYMDKAAPAALRASVQGFFTLLTFGAGWLIGSLLNGELLQVYQITDSAGRVTGHNWPTLMLIPAGIALCVVVPFALFFKPDKAPRQTLEKASWCHDEQAPANVK